MKYSGKNCCSKNYSNKSVKKDNLQNEQFLYFNCFFSHPDIINSCYFLFLLEIWSKSKTFTISQCQD